MISEDLKTRLDTFIDAILAIIITIMVLELPAESWQNHTHISAFFLAVGIYAVSFCFVANIWYQQATLFSQVKQIPRRIVIWEFILVFLLSLVPALAKKYDTPPVKIISMEMASRILPMFDEKFANYAMDYLKSHGVTMMTGSKITKIEPNAVVYADGDQEKKVEGNTIIWTVGVSGSDVIADSGFNQRRNRVVVSNHLNLTDHPEVFIIGDVSAVMTDAGRHYPTTAQISSQEGDHAGKNVAAALNGQPLTDFVYKSKGTVASLGSQDGIAQIGKSHKYTGFIAKVLKRVITDKSLLEDANLSTMLKQGRWPL